MDHDSAKKAKEEIEIRKLLKEFHAINHPRQSNSLKDKVLRNNFLKVVKSTDGTPSNNYLSTITENRFGNETEKTEENKTPPRVYSVAAFSRRKYKLDVEIEKLRKTVQRCRDSLEPLQKHVDMRLKYYQSLTRSNYLEKTKASIESSKRKKCYHDDSEGVDTDGEDSDDYDTGYWSSELDGLKIIFKKIKKEEH